LAVIFPRQILRTFTTEEYSGGKYVYLIMFGTELGGCIESSRTEETFMLCLVYV